MAGIWGGQGSLDGLSLKDSCRVPGEGLDTVAHLCPTPLQPAGSLQEGTPRIRPYPSSLRQRPNGIEGLLVFPQVCIFPAPDPPKERGGAFFFGVLT